MPLRKGSGQKTISSNIGELMESSTFAKGKSKKKKHEMAIAAAMDQARRSKKRRTLGKKKK